MVKTVLCYAPRVKNAGPGVDFRKFQDNF